MTRAVALSVSILVAAASTGRGTELSQDQRLIANASYILKFAYLTRADQLDVQSSRYAVLSGHGERVVINSPEPCVFQIGQKDASGNATGYLINFRNMNTEFTTACSAVACNLQFLGNGEAAGCYYSTARDPNWDCRTYVSLSGAANNADIQRQVIASLNFIWDNGCPASKA